MTLLKLEMLQGLSNIELAKALGMMDRRETPAGTVLFRQGDAGGSLYLIYAGRVQLYSETAGGRQPLALLGEGATLGEMALLTGEPRSATAVAAADAVLYEMDREAFAKVTEANPAVSGYFIRLLSQRLVQTNERLRVSKEAQALRTHARLGELPAKLVELLTACALLPRADADLAAALFAVDWPAALAAHAEALAELVQPVPEPDRSPPTERPMPPVAAPAERQRASAEEPDGTAAPHEPPFRIAAAARPALLERYRERHTERELADGLRRAAEHWLARGRWDEAAAIYTERGEWEAALEVAGRRPQREPGAAEGGADDGGFPLFDRCPAALLLAREDVLRDYMRHAAGAKREAAFAVAEAALELLPGELAAERARGLYESGAELCRALGRSRKALDYLRRAEAAAGGGAEAGQDERSFRLAKQKLDRERTLALAAEASGIGRAKRRLSGALALLAAGGSLAYFHFAEPVAGLSRHGMDFVGIAIAAVALWMVNLVADYLVALFMAMLWVLGGLTTPEAALSGFASTTWLYMLFILAIGAVITKSGILYRLSLHALKRFPASYRGQLLGIVAGGIALNSLIPSSSAKVSLGVPIARTLSESMGFRDRSHGAAGLGLAATVFYGFTAPFVLTGSYTNAMAFGLAAGAKQPNWFEWFLYALPAFVVFALVMLLVLRRLFTDTQAARPISREVLDSQLRILGGWTKEERWTVCTVLGSIALLVLQPLHGIDNAWIMLLGFAVLLVSGTLDTQTLRTGVDWPFLLFIGIAFSFARAAEELGVTDALSTFLGSHMAAFDSSSALFLLAVMALCFLVTLVVRDDPAVILLVIALLPLAPQAGVHPWVLIFAILLATDPFFFTFQSPTYLTAYYSAEGKSFSHRQGQKVAIGYALAVVTAVMASVPYWKWLGLIR